MSKVSISISIDTDVKGKAQELFADFPNADTIAAMKEAEEMRKRPETYKRYSSFSELLEEIEDHAWYCGIKPFYIVICFKKI